MSRPEKPPKQKELSTSEAKTLVLDELAKVSSNMAVAFSGGEHLLRPDAYDLLSYAAKLGMWSFINTNGKVLVETDAVEKALKATNGRLMFVLPINSVDGGVNRSTRDDDVATVMKAAEICHDKGAEYFFLLTISKDNLDTLDKTIKFLKMNHVPMLRAPFVPRGAGACFKELMFNKNEMREKIHPALSANPLAYISFTPFFASPELIEAAWKQFGVKIAGVGCQAGRSFAAVGAEGNVVPCVQLLDSACTRGNVREKKLSDIILKDAVFTGLRTREKLGGKCGRCRYRDTCGGCRALAYYHDGDIMGEDPTCFFEPMDGETHSELERLQTEQLSKFINYIKVNEPWNTFF
jgi:radical SAM protein with 4Fe4S-binding SPASM domain